MCVFHQYFASSANMLILRLSYCNNCNLPFTCMLIYERPWKFINAYIEINRCIV